MIIYAHTKYFMGCLHFMNFGIVVSPVVQCHSFFKKYVRIQNVLPEVSRVKTHIISICEGIK